jgi:DNA-binding transcriptional MerR regulator
MAMLHSTTNNTQSPSEEPLYNIGVVARMTNIPVATLRVWERRYDFPESSRTAGGHRLYSEKEILRLRWVKARIDEGMQTGRAIQALKHLETEDSLPDTPLTAQKPAVRIRQPSQEPVEASLDTFRQRLTAAFIEHNLEYAGQILGDILALYPLEKLLLEVIQPALVEIGQAWHDGEINVATEHLATNFIRNRMLMWLTTGPPTYKVPPVVLACAPGELHEITLLMFGVLLRRQRWPVSYLGQALPLEDLAAFVEETHPDVVVLVAMTEDPARDLASWPQWLPDGDDNRPLICYAGSAFTQNPLLQEKIPGVYLGNTMKDGIDTITRILADLYNVPL